eukprot:8878457-Heterocapsa_arctica.AAC.1
MTKKEVNNSVIPEGDFHTKEELYKKTVLDGTRRRRLIFVIEDKRGQSFRGRGQQVVYVKNPIAPPQDHT